VSTQPDQLVVRAATGEDARFILALRGAPGTATFLAVSDRSEADLRTELDAPAEHTGGLIAEHQDRPVAALRWTVVNRRSRIAELSDVMVDPRARGRGIATTLVQTAAQQLVDHRDMHRIQLEVYGDNDAAQRAFERAGFRCEGTLAGAPTGASTPGKTACFTACSPTSSDQRVRD
jgi:ribosomal protein S18 acetylase RimI-like enzyme